VSFRSFAVPEFWKCYDRLPKQVRELADKKFQLFTQAPFHPSLGLQQKGEVWTVDVGSSYRAIAFREGNDFHWFWIGSHEAYNQLLRRVK
jgi:dihydrofolate reductase